MVFIHSPIVKGYAPSLPTFDRQFFGRTNSPLYYWSEFLLTIALCPLHLLFLADQSNITTQALADILFLNQFSQSHTHKQHSTTLLSSILCFKCLKFQIAYTLSYIFSCILYTAYGLLPFCISYWFVASSLASAIFGLYSFIICSYLLLRVDIVTDHYSYYSYTWNKFYLTCSSSTYYYYEWVFITFSSFSILLFFCTSVNIDFVLNGNNNICCNILNFFLRFFQIVNCFVCVHVCSDCYILWRILYTPDSQFQLPIEINWNYTFQTKEYC